MNVGTRVALLVAVVLTVTSGPLVAGVDLTASGDSGPTGDLGKGSISVSSVTVDDAPARLERGAYGSGAYYLHAPSAAVTVESVRGGPMVGFRLRIPELGYTGSAVAFLSADDAGVLRLTLKRKAFDPERISDGPFRGELSVFVRVGGDERSVHDSEVRIGVEG